jgi:pimeloyl-ACP methyl ester carboxylesterase
MTAAPTFSEHYYPSPDGLRLYYRQFGSEHRDSIPVLCLPGLTRNSRDFETLATTLASRCRVITPDLRGRGRSDYDPTWSNYHPLIYTQDALALLDSLSISRAAIIGTSLGGMIAMAMAATQPARIAGVVLNDVGPEVAPEGIARIRGYVGKLGPVHSWTDAVAQSRSMHSAAMPDFSEGDWEIFAHRAFREDANGVPRTDYDPEISRALNSPEGAKIDLWPLYQMLAAIPVLLIRGALSDLLAAATVEKMRALKPDLRVVELPNRGHAPTLEEPAALRAIEEFLATLK